MKEDEFPLVYPLQDSGNVSIPGIEKSGTGPPGTEIGALPAREVFHNNLHRGFPLKHHWSFQT
jgi:hypothetical protein